MEFNTSGVRYFVQLLSNDGGRFITGNQSPDLIEAKKLARLDLHQHRKGNKGAEVWEDRNGVMRFMWGMTR